MNPSQRSAKPAFGLDPARPSGPAVRAILREQLQVMLDREGGVVSGGDPEELHDFRVAVRRTRAALKHLHSVLPTAACRRWSPEFDWLGGLTGPVRDLDVILQRFEAYGLALPREFRDEALPLCRFLETRQQEAHARLAAALATPRYRQLQMGWAASLAETPAGESAVAAAVPLAEIARLSIRKVLRRSLRQGARIATDSPAEDLHRLRKTCKQLRYLLEFFRDLYPPRPTARLIAALKTLQDNLGEFQDLQVHAKTLLDFAEQLAATERIPPRGLLAMGMLLEGLRQHQRQSRQAFADRFAAFSRKKHLHLFHDLLKEKPMGSCLKGKSENKPKEGSYQCDKCGAVSKKKDHLCKPEKLSAKDVKKLEKKS